PPTRSRVQLLRDLRWGGGDGGGGRRSQVGAQCSQLREAPTPSGMRCLLFLLLWGLPQIWRSSEVPQRNFPFRCLQISSFLNRSWARTDGLAWLGELQPFPQMPHSGPRKSLECSTTTRGPRKQCSYSSMTPALKRSRASVGLIAGAILMSLLIGGGLLTFWFKKRCSYQDIL
ncbi:hypothetical protein HPG69_006388, partial [Diceros bicornis minor]